MRSWSSSVPLKILNYNAPPPPHLAQISGVALFPRPSLVFSKSELAKNFIRKYLRGAYLDRREFGNDAPTESRDRAHFGGLPSENMQRYK